MHCMVRNEILSPWLQNLNYERLEHNRLVKLGHEMPMDYFVVEKVDEEEKGAHLCRVTMKGGRRCFVGLLSGERVDGGVGEGGRGEG